MPKKGIQAKKPESVFFKPLKFDYKELFKSLLKTTIHIITGKLDDACEDAVDAAAAIGIETTPEERAYILVHQAAANALKELVSESTKQFQDEKKIEDEKIFDKFDLSAFDQEIIIDSTFFDRPEDLPFIQNLKNIFKNWLVIYGISDNSSNSIANRLPSYFLYALIEEWRDNSDKYEILLRAQESPWAEAEKRDWEWREYNKFLEKQVEKSIFNEPYSLSQLYISLNAYYVDKSDRFSVDAEATSEREKVRRVVILEDELLTWVNQNNQEDAIRIISGGPGSGKSSFLKIFAAKLANQDKCKVLYVPLHLIDPTNKLIDEIESFVKDEHILSENPLNPDSPEKSLLLIFDGLDELSSQGKAAVKAVTDFIDQVEKVVERINNNELTLKVIIMWSGTGRTGK